MFTQIWERSAKGWGWVMWFSIAPSSQKQTMGGRAVWFTQIWHYVYEWIQNLCTRQIYAECVGCWVGVATSISFYVYIYKIWSNISPHIINTYSIECGMLERNDGCTSYTIKGCMLVWRVGIQEQGILNARGSQFFFMLFCKILYNHNWREKRNENLISLDGYGRMSSFFSCVFYIQCVKHNIIFWLT